MSQKSRRPVWERPHFSRTKHRRPSWSRKGQFYVPEQPVAKLLSVDLRSGDGEIDLVFSNRVTFISTPSQSEFLAYTGTVQWGPEGGGWSVTSPTTATLTVENADSVVHALAFTFDNSAGHVIDDISGLPVASVTDFTLTASPIAELINATLKTPDEELEVQYSAAVTFSSMFSQADLAAYSGTDVWAPTGQAWQGVSSQAGTAQIEILDSDATAASLTYNNTLGYIIDLGTGLPVANVTGFLIDVE